MCRRDAVINRSCRGRGRVEDRREYIFCHGRPEQYVSEKVQRFVRRLSISIRLERAQCIYMYLRMYRGIYMCMPIYVHGRAIAWHVAPCIEVRARLGQIDNPFNPKNIAAPLEKNHNRCESVC